MFVHNIFQELAERPAPPLAHDGARRRWEGGRRRRYVSLLADRQTVAQGIDYIVCCQLVPHSLIINFQRNLDSSALGDVSCTFRISFCRSDRSIELKVCAVHRLLSSFLLPIQSRPTFFVRPVPISPWQSMSSDAREPMSPEAILLDPCRGEPIFCYVCS